MTLETIFSQKPRPAQTTEIQTDRGLTIEECKILCTTPIIPLREKAFFRALYETQLRPVEVLNLQIENFNKGTGEVIAKKTKGKRNRYMTHTIYKISHSLLNPNTTEMIKRIIGQRKKGPIFVNQKGEQLASIRYFERVLSKYAALLSIQRVRRLRIDGAELPLITLMALRKAGERHHDAGGGDSSLSAQAAGHTMKTKVKYYQGAVDWEEVKNSYQKNHPAFKEGW